MNVETNFKRVVFLFAVVCLSISFFSGFKVQAQSSSSQLELILKSTDQSVPQNDLLFFLLEFQNTGQKKMRLPVWFFLNIWRGDLVMFFKRPGWNEFQRMITQDSKPLAGGATYVPPGMKYVYPFHIYRIYREIDLKTENVRKLKKGDYRAKVRDRILTDTPGRIEFKTGIQWQEKMVTSNVVSIKIEKIQSLPKDFSENENFLNSFDNPFWSSFPTLKRLSNEKETDIMSKLPQSNLKDWMVFVDVYDQYRNGKVNDRQIWKRLHSIRKRQGDLFYGTLLDHIKFKSDQMELRKYRKLKKLHPNAVNYKREIEKLENKVDKHQSLEKEQE